MTIRYISFVLVSSSSSIKSPIKNIFFNVFLKFVMIYIKMYPNKKISNPCISFILIFMNKKKILVLKYNVKENNQKIFNQNREKI